MHKVCVLAIALAIVGGDGEPHKYVTDKDEQVATLADERMELYCQGGSFKGTVDEAAAKQNLMNSLGSRNVALDVLTKATEPEKVGDVFMEDYGTSWLVSRGTAVIMALATLVLCAVFCLFSLCRCCAYERPTRRSLKNYAAGVILVVLIGLLICTINSVRGYLTLHDGLFNVQCTSVRLFDVLLRGEPEESGSFRGLLPVLQEFEKAENTLESGSAFMLGLEHVLHLTDDLNKSATLVSETLLLLKDMMKENRFLKNAAGKDLFHECRICEVLEKSLDAATTAFNDSPAGKLAKARSEVETKLTTSEKELIKGNLRESAKKLVEVKSSVVNMTSHMLEDGGTIKNMKDHEALIGSLALAVILLVTLTALVLVCCAGTSVYRFTFYEMDLEKDEQGINPYNPNVHKYAHSTWCCGFCYVSLALLAAGLIFILAAPMSSFCLLMDDLDSTVMRDIAPALGMDLSTGAGASAPDIVDQCFHAQGDGLNSYFLDIIYTTHQGQTITARERIQSAAKDALLSKFARITEGCDQPAQALANNAEVQAVLQQVGFDNIDAMLTGAVAKLKNEDDYADMGIPKAGLSGFLGSSLSCDDFAIPASMSSGSAETIPGIKSLAEKLKTMGTEQAGAGGSCAVRVTCTPGGFQEHACKAADRFIDLKAEVRRSSTFRCDDFQAPNDPSAFCDPTHMQSEEGLDGTLWSQDCLDTGGAMKRKHKTCSLPDFIDYVHAFEQRLRKMLQRLDDQIQLRQPDIGSAMRLLMEKHIVARSDFIANGVTCKFFATYYQELINGFCYQGIYGLRSIAKSYVWCAILAGLLVLSMYAVWCRTKGNIENWKSDRSEYKALLQKEKEAEEARRRAAENQGEEENTTFILGNPNDPGHRAPAEREVEVAG